MTTSPFPPPPRSYAAAFAAPPADIAKGAWGGSWTVVYGCAGLFFGAMNVVSQRLLLQFVRLGVAALGKQVVEEEDAEFPKQVASVVERAPRALGLDLAAGHWVALGLGVASIVAGFAVLRRSETGRRAAIACVGASAALSVLLTAAWAVFVLPMYSVWVGEMKDVLETIEKSSGGKAADLSPLFATSSLQQLVWQIAVQAVHVGLVWMLIVRLRSAESRAWCGSDRPGQ